jgi:hypothetical protein
MRGKGVGIEVSRRLAVERRHIEAEMRRVACRDNPRGKESGEGRAAGACPAIDGGCESRGHGLRRRRDLGLGLIAGEHQSRMQTVSVDIAGIEPASADREAMDQVPEVHRLAR